MKLFLFLTRLDKLIQVLRFRDLLRTLVRNRVLEGAEHGRGGHARVGG